MSTAAAPALRGYLQYLDPARPLYLGTFQNYFSLGLDARVAAAFHQERQRAPHKFTAQWRNKLRYAGFGCREITCCCCAGSPALNARARVATLDGTPVPLPRTAQQIVFSNIGTYSAGASLWGAGSAPDDRMLDVKTVDCCIPDAPCHKFSNNNYDKIFENMLNMNININK